jgi:putative tricarboxylic transport membrane protein
MMLNKILAGSFLLFGWVYLFLARDLPFGSFDKPNTGYVPKLLGSVLIGLALINLIIELKKPTVKSKGLETVDKKKAVLFVIGCVVYIVLMKVAGYLIATLVALWLLIRFTGIKDQKLTLLVTVSVSIFFYLVFSVFLSVPLPAAPKILSQLIPFLK